MRRCKKDGENKEFTDGENGIWHWVVRMYESKDLYNAKTKKYVCWVKVMPETDRIKNDIRDKSMKNRLYKNFCYVI